MAQDALFDDLDTLTAPFGAALDAHLGDVPRARPGLLAGVSFGHGTPLLDDLLAGVGTGHRPDLFGEATAGGSANLFGGVGFGGSANLFGGVSYGGGQQPGGGGNILGNLFSGIGSAVHNLFAGAFDKDPNKPAAPNPRPGGGVTEGSGGPSTGMSPGVARWAGQAQQTFGGLIDPDVMLAIMTNESGGDPNAYNSAGDAYGLFQQVGLGSNDPTTQFAAARKLAEEKLAGVNASYAAHGLNPDERTRARDFALAWAGHFSYETGRPNPDSRDIGSGQTADQLASIFLANYDRIKAGRTAGGAPYQGGAAGMASIWGGGNGPITQGYGAVTPGIDQGIYGYGAEYGLPQGHTGDDIGIPRGTKLYMPAGLTGVVETAGGTPYFRDEDYGDGGTPGKGELRIRLSNGDILILGHTSQISVQAGQQLNGGDFVGLSGSANGDHLHLEVRVRQPDGSYRLMDPQAYFGNTGGGGASYR